MTDLKGIKISVDADLFSRAMSCASDQETRYYLCGVHVEPCEDGGVLMVSTNGHAMIVIRDPSGTIEGGTAIVSPSKASLAACKGDRRIPTRRVLVADGRLSVVAEPPKPKKDQPAIDFDFGVCTNPNASVIAFQWRGVIVDGTFPDWRRVLPQTTPDFSKAVNSFNPEVLRSIMRGLSVSGSAAGVCTSSEGENSPAWVTFPGQKQIDGFGVIMPMRSSAPAAIPSWIKFAAPKAQKAA